MSEPAHLQCSCERPQKARESHPRRVRTHCMFVGVREYRLDLILQVKSPERFELQL